MQIVWRLLQNRQISSLVRVEQTSFMLVSTAGSIELLLQFELLTEMTKSILYLILLSKPTSEQNQFRSRISEKPYKLTFQTSTSVFSYE